MKSKEDFKDLTRRQFLQLTGAGIAGFTLAGIPDRVHGAEKKPKYGGILRVGERFGSPGLDAHRNQDFMDYQNHSLMYAGLTEMDKLPDVEMKPMLATSWEISKDGKEYIFALRQGVKFHHGKEMDTGDVKYSLERVMNPATRSPRAFSLKWIDSIQIIDRYHIKIRLKEPFAPFLASLTVHSCAILPAGVEPTATKPAPGTGPFVFKSFVPNQTTEFTRFDQYWEIDARTGDHLPYVDGIHIRKVIEDIVRLNALRAGDLDYVATPPLNIMAKAVLEEPLPGIVMDYESVGNNWIFFNLSKPPFDNPKVRQAVAYAVDKAEVTKALYYGLGETVNHQPFVNRSRFYIPVEDRAQNLAKAKQLLTEAGYPQGFKTEFLETPVSYDTGGCEAVMGQLRKIGVDATMKVLDRAAYYPVVRKGDYSISFRGDSERYDWDDAFYMYMHSSEIGKNNYSRYGNKEVDGWLEKGRATIEWKERREIYKKVIEIAKEDLPILYITKPVVGVAFRDNIKGYRKGFSVRFAWQGGGLRFLWLDK